MRSRSSKLIKNIYFILKEEKKTMASREMLRLFSISRISSNTLITSSSLSSSSRTFTTIVSNRSCQTSSLTSTSSSSSTRRLRIFPTLHNGLTQHISLRYFGAKPAAPAAMSKEDITKLRNIGKYILIFYYKGRLSFYWSQNILRYLHMNYLHFNDTILGRILCNYLYILYPNHPYFSVSK